MAMKSVRKRSTGKTLQAGDVTDLRIRNLHKETKRCFKSWCARRGYSMNDVVEHVLRKIASGEIKLELPRLAKQE